jgi:hypothetical protein
MRGRLSLALVAGLSVAMLGCSLRGLDGLARDHDGAPPGPAPGRPSDAGSPDQFRTPPADASVNDGGEATRGEPPRPRPDAAPDIEPRPADVAAADVEPEVAATAVAPRPDARDARPPDPATTVLMVVDGLPLDPDDQAIAARFAQRGFSVQICNDDDAPSCDTNRAALVFLSATAESAKVGTTFRGLPKPVVVSDNLMFDEMAFVEDDRAVDPNQHGSEDGNVIEVDAAREDARALTAGLTGMVTIATGPVHLNWGTLPSAALRAAHVVGRGERVLLFGFPTGSALVGEGNVTAAARRVGLFLGEGAAVSLTPDGWKLFDAAIAWALE